MSRWHCHEALLVDGPCEGEVLDVREDVDNILVPDPDSHFRSAVHYRRHTVSVTCWEALREDSLRPVVNGRHEVPDGTRLWDVWATKEPVLQLVTTFDDWIRVRAGLHGPRR